MHTQQQDRSRIRRAPKTAAASRAEAEKKAIEDRSTGPSPEYWQCRVPESDVAAVAGPGVFYQTKGGDTLRSIAAQVRGTTSDAAAAGDETDLLPAARIINDHPCNVKFHRRSRAASDRGQFFGTQILIRGVFADTLAGQASSLNGGQGGGYPIIRIPPAYYRGDLAGAEGWNRNDRSGIGGPGANAGGSAFVGRSCSEYVDIRDPSRQCDLTDKIEAIWAAAERMASTAYAAFPRLDAGGPSPPAKVLEALAHSFALRKDQLRDPAMFPALREIRANFGSISALLKRRAIRIECDSGGNEWGTCESPSGVVGASANRSGYMVLCAATLLGSEMSHSKGGVMIHTFYASTWDQIALTMIHEVAHYTLVGAADKHYLQ